MSSASVHRPAAHPRPHGILGYQMLYRLGLTPWDTGRVPAELTALVEGPAARPPGRALDLGCGTGTLTTYVARCGWHATGVDFIPQALAAAQLKAGTTQPAPRWLCGDVTQLQGMELGEPFDLVLDFGCFHGLSGAGRTAYAAHLHEIAVPGASFLLYAFSPGRRGPLPQGADQREIEARFGDHWELTGAGAAEAPHLPGPLRAARPTVYHLRRR